MVINYAATVLVGLATGTVYLGSILSDGGKLFSEDDISDIESNSVTYNQALAYPIVASLMLLTLYLFFSYIQYLILVLLLMSGVFSVFHLSDTLIRTRCSCIRSPVIPTLIAGAFTAITVFHYLKYGDYVCNNIIALAMSTVFIVTLRFPSIKIATIALSLLLIYDIFWVFFSEYFFGSNVMVTVATQNPSNPIYDLGRAMGMPSLQSFIPHLQLPLKILAPYENRFLMLGLGDIVLPGAFVSLCLRCDQYLWRLYNRTKRDNHRELDMEMHGEDTSSLLTSNRNDSILPFSMSLQSSNLFTCALVGYVVGLVVAFCMSYYSSQPQPALLYLVPTTIGACLLRSIQIGQFMVIWSGPLVV